MLQFRREDRKEIWLEITSNVDPTSATLALEIDGTEYTCTWDAAATTLSTDRYRRAGHTDVTFYGPDVAVGEVAGATALAAGDHYVEVLLRIGGRIVTAYVPGFTVQ